MRRIVVFIFFMVLVYTSYPQELNCRVSINHSQVKTTNIQIFQSMQKDIMEFMNTTRWTNYVFSPEERIDCSILIIITKFNGTDYFEGTIQVSSTRPVYNSSYTSPVINIKEKSGWFKFRYIENQPIEFNERSYTTELAYTLAYYAYFILGMDFDTFSENGGAEFFQKMKTIVSNAQSGLSDAWRASGTNRYDNRYYLARDLTEESFAPFHSAMYKYHRLGLDLMAQDISAGRQGVLSALKDMLVLYKRKPQSFLIRLFLDTKRDEIINIFSEAPMPEARQAALIMKQIDPSNASKYDKMGSRVGQ